MRPAGIKFAALAVLFVALPASVRPLRASDLSLAVTGNLIGSVLDGGGTPQMGASVELLNRYQRVLAKAITDSDGRFVFAGLPLETYAVRVSEASFLPAFRKDISIKAGADSILQIHLATLFSNIQVSYKLPSGAMTNDWKWALRTSAATRPVTRFLPELKPAHEKARRAEVFSDTHALLRVDGGDAGIVDTGAAVGDLGSIFALSTNLFGKNQVQIAGAFGNTGDLTPTVRGMAAVYQRESDSPFASPEITLAVSQFNRFGVPFGAPGQTPALRVMALSLYQVADPLDGLHLEYGMAAESVSYLQYTSRISPFARATLKLTPESELVASYSDGGRPDELTAHSQPLDDGPATSSLGDAVNALARLPQMSSRDGRLVLQRTQSYELGYRRRVGTRTFAVSGLYDHVWNGQLNLSGNLSQINPADLLFDGVAKTATFNVGDYTRKGFVGSVTQRLTDNLDFGLAVGRMGGFLANSGQPSAAGAYLPVGLRNVAGASFRASIPAFGTRINAGYGWVDSGAVVPLHVFTTQGDMVSPGLNFALHQPIPTLFGLPGHLEITADLRNLLAQGYMPFGSAGAGQVLVVQSPRAIRGGLNLTF